MSATGLTESTLRGTAIGLMVVTSAIFGARVILRNDQKRQIRWDEVWLLVGYLLFMAVTGVYINKTSLLFRLLAVQEGRMDLYPTIGDDALNAQKTFFFTSPGLWVTLWSIKFSLLAFYKKLMVNVKLYLTLWWVVLGYCVAVRITPPRYAPWNLTESWLRHLYSPWSCISLLAVRHQHLGLYLVDAALTTFVKA
jgi:hypothetical protein